MSDPEDLWGENFQPSTIESAPLRLLKKQAALLTTKTQGRLQGVVKENISSDGTVWMSLYVRVPSLEDYEHKLISIAHPVTASNPESPYPLTAIDTNVGCAVAIEDMASFREWLSNVLSSAEVRAVINNLMRYARTEIASTT